VPYLSASAVVIHYEEALYQVYLYLYLTFTFTVAKQFNITESKKTHDLLDTSNVGYTKHLVNSSINIRLLQELHTWISSDSIIGI